MNMPSDWIDRASCRGHLVLGPDAWFQIEKGFPRKDGASALLVCRRVCPVRQECKAFLTKGINTIAGGGWFDSRSKYHEPKDDLYDANMAAAFLGVTLERIQRLGKRRLPPVHREHGRSWYHETDVGALAEKLSPVHGTQAAYKLHHIRGERPCQRCHALEPKTQASSVGRSFSSRASEVTHSLST